MTADLLLPVKTKNHEADTPRFLILEIEFYMEVLCRPPKEMFAKTALSGGIIPCGTSFASGGFYENQQVRKGVYKLIELESPSTYSGLVYHLAKDWFISDIWDLLVFAATFPMEACQRCVAVLGTLVKVSSGYAIALVKDNFFTMRSQNKPFEIGQQILLRRRPT